MLDIYIQNKYLHLHLHLHSVLPQFAELIRIMMIKCEISDLFQNIRHRKFRTDSAKLSLRTLFYVGKLQEITLCNY